MDATREVSDGGRRSRTPRGFASGFHRVAYCGVAFYRVAFYGVALAVVAGCGRAPTEGSLNPQPLDSPVSEIKPPTSAKPLSGPELFARHCADYHGAKGNGQALAVIACLPALEDNA